MKTWISDRGKGFSGKRFRVVWIDPLARKERSKSFSLKREAEEFRTFTENAMRSGPYRDPDAGKKLFAAVAESWMASRRQIRDSTRNRDERDLRTWVLPKWAGREIGSICREEVIGWIADLEKGRAPHEYAKRDSTRTSSGLSPSSIRGLHVLVSGVLSYAVRLKWIGTNEANGVQLPRPLRTRRAYLGYSAVEALANRAQSVSGCPDNGTLIRFLAYSGTRIGEALALRVGDVRLTESRVNIERTWTDSNGSIKLGPPKSGKPRKVPLHDFLVQEFVDLTRDRSDAAWLFEAPRGGNHSPNNWRSRVWAKAISGSEFQRLGLTPHGLRHTAASMAIAAGADVKVVQNMLGHASAVETLDTYADLWPDRLNEVADKVSEARLRSLELSTSAGDGDEDESRESIAAALVLTRS